MKDKKKILDVTINKHNASWLKLQRLINKHQIVLYIILSTMSIFFILCFVFVFFKYREAKNKREYLEKEVIELRKIQQQKITLKNKKNYRMR